MTDKIIHPKVDYMPHIEGMAGVTFVKWPTFCINWSTMHINNKAYCNEQDINDGYTSHTIKLYKFRSIDEIKDFIDRNKHQIVVYDCFLQSWEEVEGVCSDPRPLLSYCKKPFAELV